MTLDQIKELAGHRDVSPWVIKLVQDAVEIEREACAKLALTAQSERMQSIREAIAAAIRARGEK